MHLEDTPDLDAARVIETFSEPLLAGEAPC